MSRKSFNELCDMSRPHLEKKRTRLRASTRGARRLILVLYLRRRSLEKNSESFRNIYNECFHICPLCFPILPPHTFSLFYNLLFLIITVLSSHILFWRHIWLFFCLLHIQLIQYIFTHKKLWVKKNTELIGCEANSNRSRMHLLNMILYDK